MNSTAMAEKLVSEANSSDGLAPIDLNRFWSDQEESIGDPFGENIPQVPLGIRMNPVCVFEELGIAEDEQRLIQDRGWRDSLVRQYNDRAEAIIGKRILREETSPVPHLKYPPTKQIHELFEARQTWHAGSEWIEQAAHNEDELSALLDRVESRDIRSFILPPNWEEHKQRLLPQGIKPPIMRDLRGPVTLAASIYGAENLCFLVMCNLDLAERFRDVILKAILGIAQVLDEEAGYTSETAPHGFSFCDDNCMLLTPEMYEFFGYPILKAVFDRYCPDQKDWRYQHSDSPMGHLLPVLSRLDFSQVNFGPTVTAAEIRDAMPNTVIQGQLAPFTFSRNEEVQIVEEFLRDFDAAREHKGLLFATAGSINNGSRLTGLRLIMSAIQRHGQYR